MILVIIKAPIVLRDVGGHGALWPLSKKFSMPAVSTASMEDGRSGTQGL